MNKRKPYHSINFVTAHDGFTLKDLVSYNLKVFEKDFRWVLLCAIFVLTVGIVVAQ